MANKILVALSGGVDSALAAYRLKSQGFEVAGAYMRTWMDEAGSTLFAECPWEEDIRFAKAVAAHLDIPFEVVNLIEDYRERVVHYLVEGYREGRTPNPDLMCNREMKFGIFREYALKQGFDGIATGHYCQSTHSEDGVVSLFEGTDKTKDQSYFLALVRQHQLAGVYFPIGELRKTEVRQMAQALNLPNAHRKDSQGICFLGKVNIRAFLSHYIEDNPGDIVNHNGQVVGQHRGLHQFTIGQRKGIGVPSNTDHQNYVVVAKDYTHNVLTIAFDTPNNPALYQKRFTVTHLSWIGPALTAPCRLLAKPRYRDPSTPVSYTPLDGGRARVEFDQEQRALTSGVVNTIGMFLGAFARL